jgi:transcription termination factor NusB
VAVRREIVDGVIDNRDAIDEQIVTHARDWKLERMPAVDPRDPAIACGSSSSTTRCPAVAIDEAVELEGVLDRRLGFVRARRARRIGRAG